MIESRENDWCAGPTRLVDRRRAKVVVIISLAISAALLLLFDALGSRTVITTTSLVIFQYEDGRVVAFSSKASVPRTVGLTDRGFVTLDFPVRRFGRPAVSTIRRQPASIQISWFTGGRGFNAPVTSAQREAIAKALREQGADAELLALERDSPIVERFWWKWGLNALACWMFSMMGIYLILEMTAYVRAIRSGLRASAWSTRLFFSGACMRRRDPIRRDVFQPNLFG